MLKHQDRMRMGRYGRPVLFVGSIAAVLLAALAILPAMDGPREDIGQSPSSRFAYPASMQDFVAESAIVISGTIVNRSFLGWTTVNYSGPDNTLVIEAPDVRSIKATPYVEITAETESGQETIRVHNASRDWQPYSAYAIRVDHVFKSDGSIAPNHEITLYKLGTLDGANAHGGPTPPLDVGDSFLFALVKAPDGIHYAQHFAGASCLTLGGATGGRGDVYETWNRPQVVRFSEHREVDDFLAELEDALPR